MGFNIYLYKVLTKEDSKYHDHVRYKLKESDILKKTFESYIYKNTLFIEEIGYWRKILRHEFTAMGDFLLTHNPKLLGQICILTKRRQILSFIENFYDDEEEAKRLFLKNFREKENFIKIE